MVDGDTNQFRSEILTKTCLRTRAYVHIYLDGMYDVQYVVVYAGNGDNNVLLIVTICNNIFKDVFINRVKEQVNITNYKYNKTSQHK